MIDFVKAERHIGSLFATGNSFLYRGIKYTVKSSGKPSCPGGEPKTDIYVLAESEHESKEFKISFKKDNANFLENKISRERAELLFGSNWQRIIYNSTYALKKEFESKKLIFKKKSGKTDAGAITLGWKFELLNVKSGELSGKMDLTRQQLIDVYSGTNLPIDKRNSYINNVQIIDSGVANFILFGEKIPNSIQDAVDMLKTIEEYVDENPYVYFACKALNYRTFKAKYDGDRPLAVYIDWKVINKKLVANFVFDTPLLQGGNYSYQHLIQSLKELDIATTNDINAKNVDDPTIIFE